MVRAPCCEKMGLKKGPWTPEEDRTLIGYIQRYGHGNWRALPKQAGLLRCGKSCRLRWTNYLRPDIKRGNFSQDEEDTIINLHEMLGNRWSAIAARLPGRTDNEIKNVWHTHLKKRLKQNLVTLRTGQKSHIEISKNDVHMVRESEPMNFPDHQRFESYSDSPVSPQQSSNENSSGTESSILTTENHNMGIKDDYIDSTETTLQEINENFWSEELSSEISCLQENFPATTGYPQLQLLYSPDSITESVFPYSSNSGEEMEFWYNLLRQAGELPDLTEL